MEGGGGSKKRKCGRVPQNWFRLQIKNKDDNKQKKKNETLNQTDQQILTEI